MAKNKQQVKFEADVEGFKQGIEEARKSIKTLNNELKLNQSQIKGNEQDTNLLSQRIETLKQKYDEQTKVVENTQKAYEKAVEILGENSNEAQNLKNQLIQAKTAQQNIQNEIDKTNKELTMQTDKLITTGKAWQESGERLKDYGNKIESVGNKLSILSAAVGGIAVASLKSSIDFESAFTGVTKTVEGTEEQLNELRQGILDLSTELPSSATEIAAVAESAGQLGIQTDNILDFTKVMIDLGNSTNVSADEASTALAKFANITKMSASDYNKLGSTIVALGNNFQTTEADIISMAQNLASTGTQVGMSQSDIMALATALSSVGLEAQAGGTAFSKALVSMQLAVETNSKDLKNWADVAGMSTKDFARMFKEDATSALQAFIKGLSECGGETESAIKVLDDMGITETRMRDALLRSANASDTFTSAIELGSKAWKENTALTKEANKFNGTTESQLKKLKNEVQKTAIEFGDELAPSLRQIVKDAKPMLKSISSGVKAFSELDEKTKKNILSIGALVVAAGPAVKIGGNAIKTIGSVKTGIGTLTGAIGLMKNGIGDTTGKSAELAKFLQSSFSPTGIAVAAIVAGTTIIASEIKKAEEQVKDRFTKMENAIADFYNGIQTADGYLDSFNSTLFVSTEEQQQLQEQMGEIQEGITKICKTASDERRGYTQEEITQLDEYFQKLRELKDREITIQQEIAGAITQQAVTNAETFKGSLDEYKVQSQEWIATAQKQAEATIKLIQDSSIEEVALLNQRYGEEANMQNEAYAIEYNKLMEQKQQKIDLANAEVAEIISTYTKGYAERANQDGDFYEHIEHYNWEQEQEANRHSAELERIQNSVLLNDYNKALSIENENQRHSNEMQKIWKTMYKNMSESEAEQLGVWLGMLAQTEMYGGKISEKNKKMVDTIIESFDSMPKDARKDMQKTMEEMLETMKNAQPGLFSKASGISAGILNRLRTSFNIDASSIPGHKDGLDYVPYDNYIARLHKGERVLTAEENKQYLADNLENKVANRNIVVQFYPQRITEDEMKRAENYIARKWGMAW